MSQIPRTHLVMSIFYYHEPDQNSKTDLAGVIKKKLTKHIFDKKKRYLISKYAMAYGALDHLTCKH